jgi:hypothetical protein
MRRALEAMLYIAVFVFVAAAVCVALAMWVDRLGVC